MLLCTTVVPSGHDSIVIIVRKPLYQSMVPLGALARHSARIRMTSGGTRRRPSRSYCLDSLLISTLAAEDPYTRVFYKRSWVQEMMRMYSMLWVNPIIWCLTNKTSLSGDFSHPKNISPSFALTMVGNAVSAIAMFLHRRFECPT